MSEDTSSARHVEPRVRGVQDIVCDTTVAHGPHRLLREICRRLKWRTQRCALIVKLWRRGAHWRPSARSTASDSREGGVQDLTLLERVLLAEAAGGCDAGLCAKSRRRASIVELCRRPQPSCGNFEIPNIRNCEIRGSIEKPRTIRCQEVT